MTEKLQQITQAADYIKSLVGDCKPKVGIVLGSGLGRLAEDIRSATVIPYSDIPNFPAATALGHKGNFIIGELGGKTVVAMQGRFHYYEGYSMDLVTIGIRVMKVLGIEYLFVSNAAGACNPNFKVGDMVVIKDHISLMPNPLIGPNMDEFGVRFPDMTCAYDMELQRMAYEIAKDFDYELKSGVYFATTGPTYETPAEIRFFSKIGADMVGMSTVPEVIVARHCAVRVFGISIATNVANIDNDARNLNDGSDVVKQADLAAIRMTRLFTELISRIQ